MIKHKKQTKFGLEIHSSPQRTYEIDKKIGTTFWTKAIETKIYHVKPVFNILDKGAKPPPLSEWIPCHGFYMQSSICSR